MNLRQVSGESMLPVLRPEQLVLIRRVRKAQVGDIIMIRHSGIDKIKRLIANDGNSIYVLGDNPGASTDSRHFGWLDQTVIVGRIIWPRKLKKQAV